MEFELKIYAIIIPTKNDFIIYNNNIGILQMYVIAQNERILHNVVQRLSEHNSKISIHRHIQVLRQGK
jgi:hypothetical protein